MIEQTGRAVRHAAWQSLLLLVVLVLAAPAAHGQPGMGFVPPPIDTLQLTDYADRLELSPAQRTAFEQLHDSYKQAYRMLEEREMRPYLDGMRSMNESIPSRHAVEELVETGRGIMRKVERLDNELLDALAPMLSAEQAARLPRVRLARARKRFGGQEMMWMAAGPPPDLSRIMLDLDLDLDPQVALAVDSILSGYESRLTAEMGRLYEASSTLFLDLFTELEARFGDLSGLTQEELMADPERMQALMEVAQEIFMAATRRLMETSTRMRDLGHATCRQIGTMVSLDDARTVNHAYISKAYPGLAGVVHSQALRQLELALAEEDRTDDERARLEDTRLLLITRIDELLDDLVKLQEEQQELFSPMGGMDPELQELMQAMQERNQALRERVAVAEAEAMQTLGEVLGEEGRMRIMARLGDEAAIAPPTDVMDAESSFWTGDSLVPNPLRRREALSLTRALELGSVDRDLLIDLFEVYAESYRAMPEIAAIRQANQDRWHFDPETGRVTPPSDADLDRLAATRRAALGAAEAADARFFADVGLALDLPETAQRTLARIAARRLRQTLASGDANMFYLVQGNLAEAAVDVGVLVADLQLAAETRATLDDALDAYHATALPAFREQRDARLALVEAQDRWQTESMRMQERMQDGDTAVQMDWTAMQRMLEGPTAALGAAAERLAALNRSSLAELAAALPAGDASRLRRAYDRAAFPDVYSDPAAVLDHLDRAIELPGLEPRQRETLQEIAAEYRPAYEQLSLAMIEIGRDAPIQSMAGGDVDWTEQQRRQEELGRLRFDRNELSYRAANRMRAILDEVQIAAVGGLPQVERGQTPWQ